MRHYPSSGDGEGGDGEGGDGGRLLNLGLAADAQPIKVCQTVSVSRYNTFYSLREHTDGRWVKQ